MVRIFIFTLFSLFLSACGGGGSESVVGSDSSRPEGTLFVQLVSSPLGAGDVSGSGYYYPGEIASLSADPTSGFRFNSWTLGNRVISTSPAYSIEIRNDALVTANFDRLFVHTTEVIPNGAGVVTGAGSYVAGDSVRLIAVPAEEYSFDYWADADGNIISDSATYTVTAENRDQAYQAFFKINQYTLSTISDPVTGGLVTGGGDYDFQSDVNLTAIPNLGYAFSGWFSEDNLISDSEILSWSVVKDKVFTAKFSPIVEVQLSSSLVNAGSLSGSGTYSAGQTVQISATPNKDHWFSHWEENGKHVSLNAFHQFVIGESRSLTAVFIEGSRPIRVRPISGGFAAIYSDGSIKTWGRAQSGGDSGIVQSLLMNVRDASGTGDEYGFSAAIRNDGSVVRWGYGVPNGIVEDLTDVEELHATSGSTSRYMFARKTNGNVVSIGQETIRPGTGIENIKTIFPNRTSFAGIRFDGAVAAWGTSAYGGETTDVDTELVNVIAITGSSDAYAALKSNKTVVSWGSSYTGGDSSSVSTELHDVQSIHSNDYSFLALKEDWTVVTWGDADFGGDSSGVAVDLVNVKKISSSRFSWAVLRENGSVVTWGRDISGGDSSSVSSQLVNIVHIESNGWGFAAKTQDSKIVSWGSNLNPTSINSELYNIVKIIPSASCFAALRADKKVFAWGPSSCSDTSAISDDLFDIEDVVSNGAAFVAIKSDGTLLAWGDEDRGGLIPD